MVMEWILDEILFIVLDKLGEIIEIIVDYICENIGDLVKNVDLLKFIF